MGNVRDRKVFNVYEGTHPDDVVMAVQLSVQNFETVAKIAGARIRAAYDNVQPVLILGYGRDKDFAEPGDYVISDLAGGHRVVDKEIFEDAYSLNFSDGWDKN